MDELIFKQTAIDALWEALYEYEDKTEKQFQESEDLDVGDWIGHRNFVQNMNDIDRQTILNLPSAQPDLSAYSDRLWKAAYERGKAEAETRWISVEERLPEKSGRYIVTRGLNACGAMWNRVYIINYSDLMGLKSEKIWWDGNVGKSDFERIDDVIAWMPLPEPYERSKE